MVGLDLGDSNRDRKTNGKVYWSVEEAVEESRYR